jgi:hypothetical protein
MGANRGALGDSSMVCPLLALAPNLRTYAVEAQARRNAFRESITRACRANTKRTSGDDGCAPLRVRFASAASVNADSRFQARRIRRG